MNDGLYLDTSIISAYFDLAKPLRQLITQKWFAYESIKYELYISTLTMVEINNTDDHEKKNNMNQFINHHHFNLLAINVRCIELADKYLEAKAIPAKEKEDAIHISAAVDNSVLLVASWNFKHIVNAKTIRKINQVNYHNNYPDIQIGSLELYGGAKYGNL